MKYLLGAITGIILAIALFVFYSLPEMPPPRGPAMQSFENREAGFALAVPEGWTQIDRHDFRNYLYLMSDPPNPDLAEQGSRSMVFAAFRDWPADGATPNVSVLFERATEGDVLLILGAMVDIVRASYPETEVIAPPAPGALGGLEGGVAKLREVATDGSVSVWIDSTYWVVRQNDGYIVLQTHVPSGDRSGTAVIDAILASLRPIGQ